MPFIIVTFHYIIHKYISFSFDTYILFLFLVFDYYLPPFRLKSKIQCFG